VSVVSVDDVKIGDGTPGIVYRELDMILQRDMEDSEYLDDIPYDEYHHSGRLAPIMRARDAMVS
jgi:hypothetical protein